MLELVFDTAPRALGATSLVGSIADGELATDGAAGTSASTRAGSSVRSGICSGAVAVCTAGTARGNAPAVRELSIDTRGSGPEPALPLGNRLIHSKAMHEKPANKAASSHACRERARERAIRRRLGLVACVGECIAASSSASVAGGRCSAISRSNSPAAPSMMVDWLVDSTSGGFFETLSSLIGSPKVT